MRAALRNITLLAAVMVIAQAVQAGDTWEAWRQRFVSADGRVIDPYRQDGSHSEGQGYGLLLAARQGDRERFERIWRWTEANLGVRRDGLFGWSWGKRRNGTWSVIDYNNATDGDLLIAWGLLAGYDAWGHEPYRRRGLQVLSAVRQHLVVEQDGYLLLAPAYFGFDGDGLAVNSGYTLLPAFRRFAETGERDFWERIARDSLRLLGKNRFGRFRLPADWALLSGGALRVDAARSPFFGYEAVRLPLYLALAGDTEHLRAFSDYLTFVEQLGYLPDRVNLVDGTIAADQGPAGFYAVFARTAEAAGHPRLARRLAEQAAEKVRHETDNYFSRTLCLLAGEAGR